MILFVSRAPVALVMVHHQIHEQLDSDGQHCSVRDQLWRPYSFSLARAVDWSLRTHRGVFEKRLFRFYRGGPATGAASRVLRHA
jgi:hypothetical protein